jgi:hypothetical protein
MGYLKPKGERAMKTAAILCAVLLLLGLAPAVSQAADHLDAPLAKVNGATDICDLYAFVREGRLVMAMTVNPFLAPGAEAFDPSGRYNFFIDTNGDAGADLSLRIDFGGLGNLILGGNLRPHVKRIFAGRREDPFFFDLGLLSNAPSGSDTFAGADLGAIVVEIDLADVTPHGPQIGIWAETRTQGVGIVDRMGRPVINTLFIPADMKDAFNKARPRNDPEDYGELIPLPDILTPDILTIDTSKPTAYPNGRALRDDVIDISLGLVFGEGTDDIDANDVPFLSEFPYLAAPHKSAAKEAAALRLPRHHALGPAHPNPFNPATEIPYTLSVEGTATLSVYNLAGQEIRRLVEGPHAAGFYTARWDGKDALGRDMASGIYLYRLEVQGASGPESLSRKMTLLR